MKNISVKADIKMQNPFRGEERELLWKKITKAPKKAISKEEL